MWIKTQNQTLLNINTGYSIYIHNNEFGSFLKYSHFDSESCETIYEGTIEEVSTRFYQICAYIAKIDLNIPEPTKTKPETLIKSCSECVHNDTKYGCFLFDCCRNYSHFKPNIEL